MKQLIIVKPNSLSPKDKKKLTKEGNVVIEHENPLEMKFRHTTEGMELDHTLCYSCGERIYMLKEKLDYYKQSKKSFYCIYGHPQSYK